jgi:hypothetical protein
MNKTSDIWDALRSSVEELPPNASLATPLSREQFTVSEIRQSEIVVEHRRSKESEPLQREKFELLFSRIIDAPGGFDCDRLPPNAEPYAAVLSLHPNIHLDDQEGEITVTEMVSESPLVDANKKISDASERTDQPERGKAVSLGEMLSNMGTPPERIECPISGCDYTNRSAESVAGHVSRSDTGTHIWANTSYAGWRDFVRKHT